MGRCIYSVSSGHIYNTSPTPEAQGTSKKRKQKDFKSQGTRKSAARLSSKHDREAVPMRAQ